MNAVSVAVAVVRVSDFRLIAAAPPRQTPPALTGDLDDVPEAPHARAGRSAQRRFPAPGIRRHTGGGARPVCAILELSGYQCGVVVGRGCKRVTVLGADLDKFGGEGESAVPPAVLVGAHSRVPGDSAASRASAAAWVYPMSSKSAASVRMARRAVPAT